MDESWPKKDGWPVDNAGLDSAPMGLDSAPMGLDSAPMGLDSAPMGMGLDSASMGLDSAPMDMSGETSTQSESGLKTALLQMIRRGLKEGILQPAEIRRIMNGEFNGGGNDAVADIKASPGRYLGKIKSYSNAKGYGFMLCTSEGEFQGKDIYIHKNVFSEIWPIPSPNRPDDIYEFEIRKNKDGKPQASRPVRKGPPVNDYGGGGGYGGPPAMDYGMPFGGGPFGGGRGRGGRGRGGRGRGGRGRW